MATSAQTAPATGLGATAALVMAQFRLQQRQFWRNRQSAVFSFGLPVMFVLLFGMLFRGNSTEGTGGVSYTSYFVAGMIGVSLLSATFSNLSITLAFQRDQLILKRMRGTPVSAPAIFAGIVLNAVIVVIIQVVLILCLGRILFDTPFPKNPWTFVIVILAGIVVFAMAGIGFTGLISNADSGPAVVQVPFLILQFISGVFFPYESEPQLLKTVANIFPLRWLIDAIRAGYLGVDYFHAREITKGGPPGSKPTTLTVPVPVHSWAALAACGTAFLVMGIWLIVFVVLAKRRFRWERRV